jgi:MFS family permease
MQSSDLRELNHKYPEYMAAVTRHYRWNFVVIMLDSSFFAFALALLSIDTIMPYFIAQLTDQRMWIGVISALYFWGFYAPQLVGAHIASTLRLRKTAIFWIAVAERIGILMIALLAQSLGLLTSSAALTLLLVSYAIFSITNGLIGPAYNDYISKNINRDRGKFYGSVNALSGIIGFGASLVARYLLDAHPYPVNLQLIFWVAFGCSFVSPFLILMFRETPFPVRPVKESLGSFIRRTPRFIVEHPRFGRYLLIRSLLGLGLMANSFYAIYAVTRFRLSDGTVGIYTMVILLSQTVLGLVWGAVGDRHGFKQVYLLAAGVIVLQGALALTATAAWPFFIVMAGIGGTYAALRTSDANMVFELAPPSETSRFIGMANTLLSPVFAAAPLIGGLLVDRLSFAHLFGVTAGVAALALVVIRVWLPEPRREEQTG